MSVKLVRREASEPQLDAAHAIGAGMAAGDDILPCWTYWSFDEAARLRRAYLPGAIEAAFDAAPDDATEAVRELVWAVNGVATLRESIRMLGPSADGAVERDLDVGLNRCENALANLRRVCPELFEEGSERNE